MQCTFQANYGYYGGGFATGGLGLRHVGMDRVIIAGSTLGRAIYSSGGVFTLGCCDLWGNQGGDWVGPIAQQYGMRGNISADPLFCNPDSLELYVAGESPCLPPQTSCDRIGAWGAACGDLSVVGEDGALPLRLIVRPNPSAGQTEISFSEPLGVPTDDISARIYDPAGRLVATLLAGSPGERTVIWNGRDSFGRPQANGVYFVRLRAGTRHAITRVALLRR